MVTWMEVRIVVTFLRSKEGPDVIQDVSSDINK